MIFNHVFCPPSPPPIFPDKNGKKSLGKFISSPTKENGNILLSYSDGDVCGDKKRIKTDIILVCKPGNSLKKEKIKCICGFCRVMRPKGWGPAVQVPEPLVVVSWI